MKTLYRTTGVFGVALLALTACEPAGDTTPEDDAQEDVDLDGAEDQGDRPGEIAGDDTEDEEAEEEGDEQPAESTRDVPDIGEIEEDMWESSTSQQSVTISGELSAALLEWDAPESQVEADPDDEDPDEDDADADEEEMLEVTVAGDLEGEGSIYRIGDVLDYVIFGDDVYQTVDSLVAEYEITQPEEAEVPEADEVREAFEEQGSWANWGQTGREYVETPEEFIRNFQEGFLAESGMESLSEIELNGEVDTQDGENVWVYRTEQEEDFLELVVLAEESEPLLMGVNYEIEGDEVRFSFSEWNDAEEPEEPEDDETIDPEETEEILQSLG